MKVENVEEIYKLTHVQRDILRGELEPGGEPQTQVCSCALDGELNVAALERSWRQALQRHQALRSSFYWENLDQPLQVVRRRIESPMRHQDWSDLPEAERNRRLERLLADESGRRFDLGDPPLMLVQLLRLSENAFRLVWTYHRLLLDSDAQYVVLKELLSGYEAVRDAKDPAYRSMRPHKDYFTWLKRQDLGAVENFWRDSLRGAPAPSRLTEASRPRDHARLEQRIELSADAGDALRSFARLHQLDVKTIFLGAWALLMSRYTDALDAVLGISASSEHPWLAEGEAVGAFTALVPFRIAVTPEITAHSWLKQLQSQYAETRRYEHVALADIRQWLGLPPDQPLFESALIFNEHSLDSFLRRESGDFQARYHRAGKRHDYPLTLEISGSPRFDMRLTYDRGAFRPAFIIQMLENLRGLIEALLAGPDRLLADLPSITGQQRRRLLAIGEGPGYAAKPGRCLPDLFEIQVERDPGQVAVMFGAESITYRELNERANRLAHYLRKLGVGPEVAVGMYARRSIATVTAMLGILKAGGVYAPLDPEYPQERVAYILTDTGVTALLTEQDLVFSLPACAAASEIVCLDSDWETIARESCENPRPCVDGANLAYIIYTSGSTGNPKGVCVTHEAAAGHLAVVADAFALRADDRMLQFASLNFDVSIEQTLATLFSGATLALRGPQYGNPADFYQQAQRDGVTVVNVPPAYWNLLTLENSQAAKLGLDKRIRLVIVGGDALPAATLRRWQRTELGKLRLLNAYGPTETTITSTLFDIPPGYGEQESLTRVPIGRPLAGRSAYILSRRLDLTPPGAVGELYIGGPLLARGYLNSPEQTAEKFVPDPWSEIPGARLYRTGDLAGYNDEGQIEFLGRVDHQVKIRGFRIELAEIETVLSRLPEVKEAVVVARDDEGGEKRLVAYITPLQQSDADRINAGALRDALKATLPDYMIPAAFVALDELPTNINGKVDRLALPAPARGPAEQSDGYIAPETPMEKALAALLAETLNIDRVGMRDNFFDLGGHSLLAAQMVSRVRDVFQIEIPLSSLFDKPVVAELAKEIEAAVAVASEAGPPLLPAARDRDLPLSFAQQRLWFLDQLEPGSAAYNMSGVIHLSGELDRKALEHSLSEIIRRHESLRSTFDFKDGKPIQVVHEARPVVLPLEDLSALSEIEREAQAERLAIVDAKQPVDLKSGPLARFNLLRLEAERHMLLLTLHHIVSDGWSIGVFMRELAALYEAFVKGQPSPLPELSIQFADYAAWQAEQSGGVVFDRQLAYWKAQLEDAPLALALPFDRPRPPAQTFKGATHTLSLPRDLTDAIKVLSNQEEVTTFMTLLASFAAMLGHWSGEEDLVIGTDVANRNRLETEAIIGLFVNQLVLRARVGKERGFLDLLKQVKETTIGAYANQDLPFDKLVEALRPERKLGRNPLFQVMFGFFNAPAPPLETAGLKLRLAEFDNDTSVFDLSLYLIESENGMVGRLRYSTELFDASTIERLGRGFETLLRLIAARPSVAIAELFAALEEEDKQERLRKRTEFAASRRKILKGAAQPKAVDAMEKSLIRTEYFDGGGTLPLVVKPAVEGVNLVDWAAHNREFIETSCRRDGAVLFRNFHVNTAEDLERLIQAISGKTMEYRERSSPRSAVSENVYTSTDYPAEQSIFPHNEHSYAKNLPMKLYFACLLPAPQGGQTPIADTRKIFRRIPQSIRERFLEKKWMYVRNFGDGFGLPWQTVFRTVEKAEVEQYCRDAGIEYEWRDGDRLRTRQVRPAAARHPRTGEMVWFNHATFFHVSTLPRPIRDALLAEFKVEDLPNNTYYGDGSEIEPSVLDELRAAYLENLTTFDWERGDVIILDNMLAAHARQPFVGPRKIIFGMAEPFTRTDI